MGLLLFLLFTGCSRGDDGGIEFMDLFRPVPEPKVEIAIGEEARVEGYATLIVTDVTRHWDPTLLGWAWAVDLDERNEIIRLEITLHNATDHVVAFDALQDFRSQGVALTGAGCWYLPGEAGALHATQLAPGRSISGFHICQVPAGLPELLFVYQPGFLEEGWDAEQVAIRLW